MSAITVREFITKIGFDIDKSKMRSAEASIATFKKSIKFGILGAVAGIAGIGVAATKSASTMEDLTTQFEVMLKSADKANELMAELETFSASTPFALGDLAKGAQTLLNFGKTQEEIIPLMQQLGDVAGNSGVKLETLTKVFGQVTATGKLQGDRLDQLRDVGFTPLKILAEQSGESLGVWTDRMSKGQVSAEHLATALKIVTSEGGTFHQNMLKQSRTFTGVVSTMKDNITLSLVAIGNSIVPILKELAVAVTVLFQHIRTYLKNNKENIEAFAQAFRDGVVKWFKIALTVFLALLPVLDKVWWVLSAFINKETLIAITGIVLALKGWALATHALLIAKALIVKAQLLILATNPYLLIAIAAVLAVALIIRHWKKIVAVFKWIWDTIKATFMGMFDYFVSYYVGMYKMFRRLGQFIIQFFTDPIGAIKSLWADLLMWFETMWNRMIAKFSAFSKWVKKLTGADVALESNMVSADDQDAKKAIENNIKNNSKVQNFNIKNDIKQDFKMPSGKKGSGMSRDAMLLAARSAFSIELRKLVVAS